jgi:branched-chain amino acid transport system substrate-binding protein
MTAAGRGRKTVAGENFSRARRDALKASVALASGAALGFPAILRAQSEAIRVGHLTPRTGFLGQIGEYGHRGAVLAVEEANAAGGVLGRKIDLIAEDSVNPATAVNKAQKLYERDQVIASVGEINSASVAAISQVAARMKRIHFNTGGNSDEVRGKNCNRYLFHVEGNNTMYVRTIGNWLKEANRIAGKRFHFLVADYAFGHDLYRASSQFLVANGGVEAAKDLIATNTQDFSAYILKIRQSKPDFVFSCLAGIDITNFIRQYREYNLPYEVTGGANDTGLFWAAGIDSLSGYWQTMWYHGIDTPSSRAFVNGFRARYKMPPENGAWADYVAMRILLQAIAETRSTDPEKLIAYFDKGATFDVLKGRRGVFAANHQLLQEMYVVRIKEKSRMQDQWDIFEMVRTVPGANDPLTLIQPSQQENPCPIAG